MADEETNKVKSVFICKEKDHGDFCYIANKAEKHFFTVLTEEERNQFEDVYEYITMCLESYGFRQVEATVFTI